MRSAFVPVTWSGRVDDNATYGDGSLESFTYDPVGNRKTRTDEAGNVTTYSYDIANQLLTAGTDTFVYDANGSTLTKTTNRGTTTFTYDFNNRLKTISGPDGSESNQYAPDGIRTQAAGIAFENHTRGVIYDQIGNPIIDTLSGWNPAWIYRVYGPGIDEPLAEWRNNGNRKTYLHHDALGSVTLVSDATGGASYRSTYRAFGEMNRAPDPAGTPTRLGYTSREISAGSVMNYRSRYYEPAHDRFTSADSYRGNELVPPSLHRYTYVHSNPIRYTDPWGEAVWDCGHLAVIGGWAGVGGGTIAWNCRSVATAMYPSKLVQALTFGVGLVLGPLPLGVTISRIQLHDDQGSPPSATLLEGMSVYLSASAAFTIVGAGVTYMQIGGYQTPMTYGMTNTTSWSGVWTIGLDFGIDALVGWTVAIE